VQEVRWVDEEPVCQTGGLQRESLMLRRLPAAIQAAGGKVPSC